MRFLCIHLSPKQDTKQSKKLQVEGESKEQKIVIPNY